MKKFLIAVVFGLASLTAFAEASFDQIQSLINSKQYAAAEQGLEIIIKNHPQSAKAYYSMAEAQAGLGNLDKAQKALNLAKGIDPSLKFVSEGSVRSLEQAITPQTAKITYEEPSHFWRNLLIILVLAGAGYGVYRFFTRKPDEDEGPVSSGPSSPKDPGPVTPTRKSSAGYVPPAAPVYREPVSSRTVHAAQPTYTPTPQPTTTVVNNSNDGLLTGVLIGNMMSNSHHDTVVRERVIEREVPAKSSSWDSDSSSSSSKSSRSSSWDDDTSSKKSSSWDSDSSSSSSSWSSSSDSSSSSSWDSGSSSSSSSWD